LLDVDLTVIPVPWNECGCVVVLRDVREQRAVQAKGFYPVSTDGCKKAKNF